MQQRQLYLHLFAGLIIPVLGFWIWNWSLYFILLFYIMDVFSSEIVMHLKVKKIKSIAKKEMIKTPSVIYSIVSVLFLTLIIAELNIGIIMLHPEINIQQEVWNFLAYKELGISQGFVLVPLIAMMAYTSYKTEFLLPKVYLRQNEKTIWKQHLKKRFLLLSFCVILTFVAVAFQFSEALILGIMLVITTRYNYLQGKEQMKEISMK